MPYFSYQAVGRDGVPTGGTVEADGLELASRQLRAQGLTIVRIAPGSSAAPAAARAGGKAASRQDILAVTHELAVLLRAGLPLDRALKVLIEMAAQPQMHALLSDILAAVKGGRSFSAALEPHEQMVGPFYISMVRAGESSGRLAEALERLVEHLERARANRDTVISALIYPAILSVILLGSLVMMLGFVVPQFEALFEDMGDALPALTSMVIGGGNLVKSYGVYALLLLVAAGIYLRRWSRTEAGRMRLHRRMLGLPLAGPIIFEYEMSNFSRTVGTLLANGVSLLKAIAIAINTVNNRVLREALQVLPPAVKAGRRISAALDDTGMFTPMVIQMIRVGEESGSLDSMMLELARVFDDRVQSGVKRGLTLLEPALILVMGVIIAVIIIAILMGILSVNDLAV